MNEVLISAELKIKAYEQSGALLQKKSDDIKALIYELTDALKNDSKSSMGDKHETSRAMNQLEQEKLSNQLNEIVKQHNILKAINIHQKADKIISGSMIKTDNEIIFIAVAIGKIIIDKQNVIIISAQSPLGTLFLSQKKGDTLSLNSLPYKIIDFI